MASLPPGTPVYIGRLARRMIDATQVFLGRDRYTPLPNPTRTSLTSRLRSMRPASIWNLG